MKEKRYFPRTASRISESARQFREREASASGLDERLHIQREAVGALADALHAVAFAQGAAGCDAPACRESVAEGFDRHENKRRT
jgi:hypothetical protein